MIIDLGAGEQSRAAIIAGIADGLGRGLASLRAPSTAEGVAVIIDLGAGEQSPAAVVEDVGARPKARGL